jgi:TolB-like protein/tetratricopeptide (TPR) repeat protein
LEDKNSTANLSEQEVRAELARLLQSPLFAQSDRLGRFLRFAIENALAGTTDALKEYVIGAEVYDRKPPYHPSHDSIVRTEARRLRTKLKEYYESEGKGNPVFIYFRPGTYVPVFRKNEPSVEPVSNGLLGEKQLFIDGVGVAVAVLPFVDLSDRPLSARCAQGITDEITHGLTHTSGIRVIARASLSQFIAAPYDLPSLSEKLGVQNIIEGSVREDDHRLRITVRVLSSDGFQLSSHRFDTEANAESLFQIQEQIATAFINRVRPQQSLVRRRKATPGALVMAAYPLVMHAETLLDEGTVADVPAALVKFQEASEVAPGFARPFCGISHCHAELALRGANASPEPVSHARAAALRAIELDPEMIECYACLGVAQALEWNWEDAEKSFRTGVGIGLHVSASRRFGLFLTVLGRFDEASHHLEIAQTIDPFSNRQKIARLRFLLLTRRYEEGVRQLSEALVYGPLPVGARFVVALMCALVGSNDQAKRLTEGFRPASGAELPMMAGVAEILALSGEMDQANRIVHSLKLFSSETGISQFRRSLLAAAFGDTDRSLALLTLSVNNREAEAAWIGVDPRLDSLRARPGFAELVERVLPGFTSHELT